MAILQITLDTEQAISKQTVSLEGKNYIFRFTWNNRDNSWNMDIMKPNDIPIIMGIKLVVNYELISRYIQEGVPPGMIILFNEKNVQYDRYDINQTHFLVYITSDDEILA